MARKLCTAFEEDVVELFTFNQKESLIVLSFSLQKEQMRKGNSMCGFPF